jgi:hypothetical protein
VIPSKKLLLDSRKLISIKVHQVFKDGSQIKRKRMKLKFNLWEVIGGLEVRQIVRCKNLYNYLKIRPLMHFTSGL